ncbi:TonB-dependent receptor plug domain-containing protein [Sorangium sp. So ce1078]|uniref:TonB-dependent receptor plug domain-containing protein n=1 Tax=Sorangium sp. So ce1078 TaxID=3133329 RepID=UPI003F622270
MTTRTHSYLPQKRLRNRATVTAALLWLMAPRVAHSQSAVPAGDFDETALNQLSLTNLLDIREVTTASGGKAESQDLSSANVFVYTREDIKRHGWSSLAEVLAHVPGLYVIDDLVTPTISVRGTTGGLASATRIVKVMINGIEVSFRPDMTAFLGPEYVPIDAVEQVDIARGPLSAVYGTNAFIATINVITREPTEGGHGAAGLGYSTSGASGLSRWATVTYGSEHLSLLMSTSDSNLDRSGLAVQQTFPKQDPTSVQYKDFFETRSKGDLARPASFYANLRLSREGLGELTVQGGAQHHDAHGEFQSFSALTHNSKYVIDNYWASATGERKWSNKFSTWASLGWSQGAPAADDLQYLSGSQQYAYHRNFSYHAFDGRLGLAFDPVKWLSTALGFDAAIERHRVPFYTQIYRQPAAGHSPGYEESLLPDGTAEFQHITNMAVHGQVAIQNLKIAPDLVVLGDFRLDKSNLYPAATSWRTAVGYRLFEDVTVRVVGGRAFQAPSALLLFANPGFGTTGNIIGNRSAVGQLPLLPQVVESGEFILNIRAFEAIEISSSVFYQQLERSIDFATNGLGFIAKNGPTRNFVGTELAMRLARGRYHGEVGLAYQKQFASDETDPTKDLAAPPLFPNVWGMSSFGLDIPEAYLQMTATARWVGERGPTEQNLRLNDGKPYTLPAYMRVDLMVSSHGFKPLSVGETRVSLAIRNLTDARYSEPGPVGMDLPTLGRTFTMRLAQELW